MAFTITNNLRLPHPLRQALSILHEAGHEAYLVGGAVRELVAGRSGVQDWDLTTSAPPQQVMALFSQYKVIETGLRHGTVTVILDGMPLEITTYRVDGEYSDHRRPDSVHFTRSLTEDLMRRDFTMNAMAYAPGQGLIDPFGGQEDIQTGLVRCVGDPDRRFQEDGLRILRAIRFASVLSMEVEENTATAIHRNRELLTGLAAERIREELTKTLCGASVVDSLRTYADVLAVPIPELATLYGFEQHNIHHDRDVWEHTLAVVAHIPPRPVLRWAALLHDIGKPACYFMDKDGTGHFYGHGERGEQLAQGILSRLRFDRAGSERILALVRYHDELIVPERRQVKRLLNRFGEDMVRDLIDLHRADTLGQAPMCQSRLLDYDRALTLLDELLEERACVTVKELEIGGQELLALGLTGVAIGTALKDCLEAVIDERVPNQKEALLRYVQERQQR